MERHPITAILLTCSTCGLVRMADDYGSAHARGNAHIRLSGHPNIKYAQIEAPKRTRPTDGTEADVAASQFNLI